DAEGDGADANLRVERVVGREEGSSDGLADDGHSRSGVHRGPVEVLPAAGSPRPDAFAPLGLAENPDRGGAIAISHDARNVLLRFPGLDLVELGGYRSEIVDRHPRRALARTSKDPAAARHDQDRRVAKNLSDRLLHLRLHTLADGDDQRQRRHADETPEHHERAPEPISTERCQTVRYKTGRTHRASLVGAKSTRLATFARSSSAT